MRMFEKVPQTTSSILRKKAEYELKLFERAIIKQREIAAKELGISIFEIEKRFLEDFELTESIYKKAVASLPKSCRLTLSEYT
jgi:hypothetical protein